MTPTAYVYDDIAPFGVNARDFVSTFVEPRPAALTVRINSRGGDVFDGLGIYNALRTLSNVTVHIDGLAASIASVVAMAGKKIVMAPSAFVMIHNPWTAAAGDAADMRENAELLDKIKASLVSIYVARTKKPASVVTRWMDEATWFSAEEAIAAGLADSISKDPSPKAQTTFDLSRFSNVPKALATQGEPNMKQLLKALADAKLIESADIDEAKALEQFNAAFKALATKTATLEVEALLGGQQVRKEAKAALVAAQLNSPADAATILQSIRELGESMAPGDSIRPLPYFDSSKHDAYKAHMDRVKHLQVTR